MNKIVIIGGMYRSGTTLAETIIGSHPDISVPPRDFPFFEFYKKGTNLQQVYEGIEKRGFWRRLKEEVNRKTKFPINDIPDFSRFFCNSPQEAYIKTMNGYAELISKKIPGIKCPQNEFHFEILKEWFSGYDLRFIHLYRNPFDMVASYLNSSYYSEQLKRNPENIGIHARNWYRSVSLGLARMIQIPHEYYLLKYEDLTDNPKDTAEKLCDFLGVDFDEKRMLNAEDFLYYGSNTSFENQSRSDESHFIQMPKSRKKYLNDSQIQVIGSICGELAIEIGYKDADFHQSWPEKMRPLKQWLRLKKEILNVAAFFK
jgi:hypothetical protein